MQLSHPGERLSGGSLVYGSGGLGLAQWRIDRDDDPARIRTAVSPPGARWRPAAVVDGVVCCPMLTSLGGANPLLLGREAKRRKPDTVDDRHYAAGKRKPQKLGEIYAEFGSYTLQAAMGPSGEAIVEWGSLAETGAGDSGPGEGFVSHRRRASGRFAKARRLARSGSRRIDVQVAYPARGRPIVAWNDPDRDRAHVAESNPTRLMRRRTYPLSDEEVLLATSPSGSATLAWSDAEGEVVFAAFRPPGRAFGKHEPVTRGPKSGDVRFADVAVDPS